MERNPTQEERIRQGKPGDRVRYWRQVRGYPTIGGFAEKLKCKYTTLASLESGKVVKGMLLPQVAQFLGIDYDYLLTGKGEPEMKNSGALAAKPPPSAPDWPLPGISRARFEDLDEVELGFLQSELTLLLDKIDARRRERRRG